MQTNIINFDQAEKIYIAIDLKSYYASVECVERGLDPMTTNLVVADASRTEKTICLAVSPSLKAYGIPGRARLFEVVQKVKEANASRLNRANINEFTGSSYSSIELSDDPTLKLDYIVAPPRMRKYMEISSSIYEIYLKYVSPEDIHVYSIDECFIDVTSYLSLYNLTAHELCMKMIRDILAATGITATGGIGANLFLCKVAMDIVAKHVPADKDGVRIAELDEQSYRRELWDHEPITDFWRVGKGIAKQLAAYHIYTMGDIARCSLGLVPLGKKQTDSSVIELGSDGRSKHPDALYNEKLLYKLFGVNAELLIDHAWGYEPTTLALIKSYKPENNSISTGQVLSCPYTYEKTRIIVREMTDLLVLDLVDKGLITDQIVLTVGYDIDNKKHQGTFVSDHYGRKVPKPAHGSINLGKYSSSTTLIMEKSLELFDNIIDKNLLIRRLSIAANHIIYERDYVEEAPFEQMDLFTDYEALQIEKQTQKEKDAQEKNLQKALISIHKKYGKNAVLKGTSFQEGATTIERNGQVGGHKG